MRKKNKKEKVDIQSSLTDEQLELLGNRINQVGDDRSQIEPFDKSASATAVRYAKKNKFMATVIVAVAVLLVFVLIFLNMEI